MHLVLVMLFSGLLLLSGAASAGDGCIPRYPAKEKSGAATMAFAKAEPVRIASEAPSPGNALGAIASAQVAAGEYHSPASYGAAAKSVAVIGVGFVCQYIGERDGQRAVRCARRRRQGDRRSGRLGGRNVCGRRCRFGNDIYADLKKASIDVSVGNEAHYENYTAAVGNR